jgi:hypothetical protein
MDRVFLAVPAYGAVVPQALPGLLQPSLGAREVRLVGGGGSLLANGFNRLWVQALNERPGHGWTHFAMHHADVQAPPGWVDTLADELDRVGADVISAVVPIKDYRGLTSTGWRDPASGRITRFTLKEVLALPETFDAAAAGKPDMWLMVNTGLWLCRLTEPWAEEVCFGVLDGVSKDDRGRFTAHVLPEDWNFSGWCARKGLRVFATRKVAVGHHGAMCYSSDAAWGAWDTDLGD